MSDLSTAEPVEAVELANGIYRSMPAATYHEIDRCSNSRLNDLNPPARLRYKLDNPAAPACPITLRDPLEFGGLLHTLVLDRVPWQDRRLPYEKMPPFKTERGGTSFKERDAWMAECGNHGVAPVHADAWDAAAMMAENINRNTKARALIKGAADFEQSVLFDDRWYGEACKMRADIVCPMYRVGVDLKTTEDASRNGFQRSISRYGYHRQAAFYLHGLAIAGISLDYFAFIVVEKSPPYAVAVYQLSHEAIQQGEEELRPLISRYQRCRHEGRWPDYQSDGEQGIETIDLPPWHYSQWENGAA